MERIKGEIETVCQETYDEDYTKGRKENTDNNRLDGRNGHIQERLRCSKKVTLHQETRKESPAPRSAGNRNKSIVSQYDG